MARGEVPPGVAIFRTKTDFSHSNFFQWVARDWLFGCEGEIGAPEMSAFTLRTYKVAIHVRELVLTLVYVPPEAPWRLSIWSEMHEPVLNTGVLVEGVPWTLPYPTGPGMGYFAPMSILLSHGRYPVDVRPNGRVSLDGRPAPCYEHDLQLIEWCENFPLFMAS